jgi:Protein of unknown function (DUF3182)
MTNSAFTASTRQPTGEPRRKAKLCAQGSIVLYQNRGHEDPSEHEAATLQHIANKLARIKGYTFAGNYDSNRGYSDKLYFVPTATVTDCETARGIGIRGEGDLFGGVVPHPYMATKAITHPLVDGRAVAPEGWSYTFAQNVKPVTLYGFSAFTLNDALRAGALVLDRGPARVKPANGVGGRGQIVVSNNDDLNRALRAIGDSEIARCGVVIEQNLAEVTTFSVGQVRMPEIVVTYYGRQRLTKDNKGSDIYGGSALTVVRGDFEELEKLVLTLDARLAIDQARAYDAAARELPGFIASRRNYDVAQGLGADGRGCSGVLEQSWRIGGASSAELDAAAALHSDPTLQAVRARCVEAYGEHEPPPNAAVHFRGIDDRVGPIIKYTVVEG